jgi:hypothetical protein
LIPAFDFQPTFAPQNTKFNSEFNRNCYTAPFAHYRFTNELLVDTLLMDEMHQSIVLRLMASLNEQGRYYFYSLYAMAGWQLSGKYCWAFYHFIVQ